MRALSGSELLRVWERGRRQTAVRRTLLLLAAAMEMSLGDLAQISIGRRDAHLLTLRECVFGAAIESAAACPQCGEDLELIFEVDDLRAPNELDIVQDAAAATQMLQLDGYEISFRPPNSADLEAIAGVQNADAACAQLLAQCTLEIRRPAEESRSAETANELPPNVIQALAERLEEIDSQANVRLNLSCPACLHEWTATFDIATFLWSEIDEWARQMMREIHMLASAYGWREKDILELSAERRGYYLALIENAND